MSDDIDGGNECGTAKTLISVWSVGVPNCQSDALFFLFTLTYRYKEGYEEDYGLDSLRLHYGFVAQDYEKTMPDATYFDDESGKRKIDQTEYSRVWWVVRTLTRPSPLSCACVKDRRPLEQGVEVWAYRSPGASGTAAGKEGGPKRKLYDRI
ncbi:MAG: hypothetical protein CBC12_05240 [Candidatus Puniceispirillum sp. TMED52]|nr:MAG: hypothetical protein CBC12_05240 [Candidatus Puniceispirillum sp. TMED52]